MSMSTITACHARLRRDERGTVTIITSAFFAAFFAVSALAVDLGALYSDRRHLQGAADLAALAAANDLENATDAALATLASNGVHAASVTVTLGRYEPNIAVPPGERFAANQPPFNAARVEVTTIGHAFFAGTFTGADFGINVTSVAANSQLASFSVGSRLLAVRGGILNSVLGKMLGGNISLSVMDYNQLLQANVGLFDFLDSLATQINLKGVSYDDVLASSVTVRDVFAAAIDTAGKQGNSTSLAVLERLAKGTAGQARVPLSSMINLGPLGSLQTGDTSASAYGAKVNLMDLVTGTAALANGKHQVVVDLQAQVPGLAALTLTLAIGEPAQHSGWVAVGGAGSTVSTAQTRLALVAQVGGTGILAGMRIRLPIYLDLATAQATLASVSCARNGDNSVEIAAQPGLADLWIGNVSTQDLLDFGSQLPVPPAAIVTAPLVTVSGSAHVNMDNLRAIPIAFNQSDISNGTVKQVDTQNFAQSLATSLLGNLQLKVSAAGLALAAPKGVGSAVAAQLGSIAAPLDGVLYETLIALGVHVGEADIRVDGARCAGSVTVG